MELAFRNELTYKIVLVITKVENFIFEVPGVFVILKRLLRKYCHLKRAKSNISDIVAQTNETNKHGDDEAYSQNFLQSFFG
jgi:hypothetical protein